MKKKQNIKSLPKAHVYWLFAGLILFTGCSILVRNKLLASLEQDVVLAIYNLPSWLAPVMFIVTLVGSTFMALVVVVWLYWFKQKKTALFLFVSVMVAYISVQLIKYLFDMPRPFEIEGGVVNRELFVFGAAFPSGHTTNATVLALGLYPIVSTGYRKLLILWVVGVAFSRIYLGVHGLIDVVAGFAIGVVINQVLTIYRHKR